MKTILCIVAFVLLVAFCIVAGHNIREWEDEMDRTYWNENENENYD